jgi:hypothetical protein
MRRNRSLPRLFSEVQQQIRAGEAFKTDPFSFDSKMKKLASMKLIFPADRFPAIASLAKMRSRS